MDFRLAHRLGALGGQYTVPPPVLYCQTAVSCLAMFLATKGLVRCGMVICSVSPRLQISCLPLRCLVHPWTLASRLSCLSFTVLPASHPSRLCLPRQTTMRCRRL